MSVPVQALIMCSADGHTVTKQGATGGVLQIAVSTTKQWGAGPSFRVKFIDTPMPSAELRAKIVSYMNEWKKYGNVNFAEGLADPAHKVVDGKNVFGEVRVTLTGTGHWSYIGTDILLATGPTMCLQGFDLKTPDTEYSRVVIHEAGHTLGFVHEHLRKALVDKLNVDATVAYYARVYKWSKEQTQREVLTPAENLEAHDPSVDPTSIMCYEVAAECTKDNTPIVGGKALSQHDKDFVAKIYGKPLTVTAAPHGLASTQQQSQQGTAATTNFGWCRTDEMTRLLEEKKSGAAHHNNHPHRHHHHPHGNGIANGNGQVHSNGDASVTLGGPGPTNSVSDNGIGDTSNLDGSQYNSLPLDFHLSLAATAPRKLLLGADEETLSDKLVKLLFESVLSNLTTSVTGAPPIVDPKVSYIQFASQGMPINPVRLNNLVSAENPGGDVGQSEYFSNIVNANSFVLDIESAYSTIIASAHSTSQDDPTKLATYNKAFNYLNTIVKVKNFDDTESESYQDSPIYARYKKLRRDYIIQVQIYQTHMNAYDDLTKPDQQRKWLAEEPLLRNDRDAAYDDWRNSAPMVEQALNALQSLGQSLPSSVIAHGNQVFANTQIPTFDGSRKFHMSFPEPADFATQDSNYSHIIVDSSKQSDFKSESFSAWKASGGFGGFFSADASGSHTENHTKTEATAIKLDLKAALVRIDRPWLTDTLFKINGWNLQDQKKGYVSLGNMDDPNTKSCFLPSYPIQFIVVKDVTITADWSESDSSFIEDQLHVSGSAGWGPFHVSGGYDKDNKTTTFNSNKQGNALMIPGMQIIGWVNTIVPFSPQEDYPSKTPVTGN